MAQARRGGRRRQCGGYGSSPKAGRRVLPKAANSHSDRPRVLPDYRRLHRAMHEPPHLELYAPGLITALQTHVRRQGLPRSWREVRAAAPPRARIARRQRRWLHRGDHGGAWLHGRHASRADQCRARDGKRRRTVAGRHPMEVPACGSRRRAGGRSPHDSEAKFKKTQKLSM
jgi:hypothetical protein